MKQIRSPRYGDSRVSCFDDASSILAASSQPKVESSLNLIATQPDSETKASSYRPDIDGLRAVSVIGVVLYHAGLGVPGGFSGVDVFFVISGYLIARLILRELRAGQFSILTFWERRIRRILPALAVVVSAVLIAGWFLLLPFHYLVVGQSTVALFALSSNVQFWRTSDYFSPHSEENPLLHTWSLSVEEQFYLIVPFLLILLFRYRRESWVAAVFIVGSCLSFLVAIVLLRHDPSGAFYLLPSRAWEIGVGCTLAVTPPIKSYQIRAVLGHLGIALILAAFFLFDLEDSFPGIGAIPPVFGAAFLILAGGSSGSKIPLINRVLSTKVLVFVGLCSYSFYLWHWPFFAFHRYVLSNPPTVPIALGYIALSFLISMGSLRFVERPFRARNSSSSRSQVFAFGGLAMLVLFVAGFSIYLSGGARVRISPAIAEMDSANGDQYFTETKIQRTPGGLRLRVLGTGDSSPTLLVWGDSHGLALLPAVDSAFKKLGRSAVAATKGGAAPVLNWGTGSRSASRLAFNDSVIDYARGAKAEGLSDVLLVLFWSAYVQEQRTPAEFPSPPSGFPDALLATVLELQNMGLRVVLLLETPVFPVHVPRSAALHEWLGTPPPELSSKESRSYRAVYNPILERIRTKAPETVFLDPQPLFLGRDAQFEVFETDGRLLFRDRSHLTRVGAMRLEAALLSRFGDRKSAR